ncbi:MAG: hypothetical protein ACRD0P_27850, partial [Stackebrandtia sp.]
MTTHDEHPNRYIGEHNSGGFMNTPDGKPANGPANPATNDATEDTTNADDQSANGAGTVVPLRPNAVRRLDDVPEQRPPQGGHQSSTELVADDAITGELLSDEESAALDRRLGRRAVARVATGTVQVARVVRESEHPRTVGKATLRHSLTVVQGMQSWTVRAWDASTLGVYRRQIKAA